MNTDYLVLDAYIRYRAAQEECRQALKALRELKDYPLARTGITIFNLTPGEMVKGTRAIREITGLNLKDAKNTWEIGGILSD